MGEEFYIGYLDKAPHGVAQHIKKVIALLVVLVIFIAWLLASQQRGFASSTYQYAEETTITGILEDYPIPTLVVYQGMANREPIVQHIPLVQFGKIGGKPLIDSWREHLGSAVNVSGHLIFYDGKALLEVTDAGNLSKADLKGKDNLTNWAMEQLHYNQTTFVGEIVDAKCYFGVMKPGHGKPHRSCAIRCISGGIPAVLKVSDELGRVNYHLIHMEHGTGRDMAARIGEAVEVKGSLVQTGDWSILTIIDNQSITPLSWSSPDFSRELTLCK